MNQRERRAEQGLATVPRPVVELPGAGSRASRLPASSPRPVDRAVSNLNPADRNCLLSMAREQGLLPSDPVADRVISPAADFRTCLARVRNANGSAPLTPLPFVEAPDLFDPALDGPQQDAIARASQTPDLLLIQGLPGTGKTRVIAEIVRQAVRHGRRVLLTASGPAAVDAVLARLEPTVGLSAIRLLGHDERLEDLSAAVADLTPLAQEREPRLHPTSEAGRAGRARRARSPQVAP